MQIKITEVNEKEWSRIREKKQTNTDKVNFFLYLRYILQFVTGQTIQLKMMKFASE